jgi:hypothetical protein
MCLWKILSAERISKVTNGGPEEESKYVESFGREEVVTKQSHQQSDQRKKSPEIYSPNPFLGQSKRTT